MDKKDLRIKEYMGEYSVQQEIIIHATDSETNEEISVYEWEDIDTRVFPDLQTAKEWALKFIKASINYHEI